MNTSLSTRAILEKLIAFPTLCRTENVELIDWIEAFLRDLGARCLRVAGEHPGRFNLFASIGPETDDGIVLSGHSDVVPVEGQPWTTDPFALTERNGKRTGAAPAT